MIVSKPVFGRLPTLYRMEELNASEQRQSFTINFLAVDWTTQYFQQERMVDEDIEPILTAKRKVVDLLGNMKCMFLTCMKHLYVIVMSIKQLTKYENDSISIIFATM